MLIITLAANLSPIDDKSMSPSSNKQRKAVRSSLWIWLKSDRLNVYWYDCIWLDVPLARIFLINFVFALYPSKIQFISIS